MGNILLEEELNQMKKITYSLVYAGKKQRFARSVVVGDIVFVSGSSGRTMETGEVSSDNIRDQMIVALDKIRGALEEAGSSMDNIVKTFIMLKHVEDYQIMRDTELEYYRKYAPFLVDNPPASTFMQPASLSKPNMLVEIEVTAVKK
jgi:2-iminobutanoate/2-iminopropanoate deaminase